MALAETISKNLRAMREASGLSQQDLAKKTGVSLRYISNLENDAPNVTVDVLEKLAKGLDCHPAHFIGDPGHIRAGHKAIPLIDQAIRALKGLRSLVRHPKA